VKKAGRPVNHGLRLFEHIVIVILDRFEGTKTVSRTGVRRSSGKNRPAVGSHSAYMNTRELTMKESYPGWTFLAR